MALPKGPKPQKVVAGLVRVTLRLTYADGTDSYRSGVTDLDDADKLAFRYARALRQGWLSQLVDKEPPPDAATVDQELIKELNVKGSGMTWEDQWQRERAKKNAAAQGDSTGQKPTP